MKPCQVSSAAFANFIARNTRTTHDQHRTARPKIVRTSLRVATPSVVGSRRLLTEHDPRPAGSSWGVHALSRKVHPQEDRGVAAGAAHLPHRALGIRHFPDGARGRSPAGMRHSGGEGRSSAGGHGPGHPERAPPDPCLPRRPQGLQRPPAPAAPTGGHRPGPCRCQGQRPAEGHPRRAELRRRHSAEFHPRHGRGPRRAPRIGRPAHHRPLQGDGVLRSPHRSLLSLPDRTPHDGERVDGQAGPRTGRHLTSPRNALPRRRPGRLVAHRRAAHRRRTARDIRSRGQSKAALRDQRGRASRRGAPARGAVLGESGQRTAADGGEDPHRGRPHPGPARRRRRALAGDRPAGPGAAGQRLHGDEQPLPGPRQARRLQRPDQGRHRGRPRLPRPDRLGVRLRTHRP